MRSPVAPDLTHPNPKMQFHFFCRSRLPFGPPLEKMECSCKSFSSSVPIGKYFARSAWAHSEFGFCTSRQPCLASIAWLKMWISQNPNPPFLSAKSASPQCSLFFSSWLLHQYLRIIILIWSHISFVMSKHPSANVGIAWATALISTSFPTLDRSFSFHPCILFQILSFK
jgi:hypothetical protein